MYIYVCIRIYISIGFEHILTKMSQGNQNRV